MKRFLKRFVSLMLVLILSFSLITVFLGFVESQTAIQRKPIADAVLAVQNDDTYVGYDDISTVFKEAIVSVEDSRYWTRSGVLDYKALGRAVYTNITTLSLREGGSTIPQQVAKNLYFENNLSFVRKVAEVFIAHELIDAYPKEIVLELYINVVYYGNGAYGIQEASQNYFGVDASALNAGQATLLAGLPQAPSAYDLTENMGLAKERQQHVIDRMVANNYITEEEGQEIFEMEVFLDD